MASHNVASDIYRALGGGVPGERGALAAAHLLDRAYFRVGHTGCGVRHHYRAVRQLAEDVRVSGCSGWRGHT